MSRAVPLHVRLELAQGLFPLAADLQGPASERVGHSGRREDQICDQALVHVQQTFVFAEVTCVVALVEYTPNFCAKSQGVRQYLENDVAV